MGFLLSDFTAKMVGNTVEFSWVATSENNMKTYELEKSVNGSSFASIGLISAQNNAAPYQYTYSDGTPSEGYNDYRLSSTDKTGKVTYSSILKIDNSYRKPDLKVIPNPVKNGVLNLQISNLEGGKYNLLLYNNEGRQVFGRSFDYTSGSATETVYLPQNLSAGSYFLQLTNGREKMNRQVMIIQ